MSQKGGELPMAERQERARLRTYEAAAERLVTAESTLSSEPEQSVAKGGERSFLTPSRMAK
jgi:hypothetical protein